MKMPTLKHSDKEKQLCQTQTSFIENHPKECNICKASLESYNKSFGIAQTPPCKQFMEQMQSHIPNCKICSKANKNWNDDAIPISENMRTIAGKLGRGQMPSAMELENIKRELKEKLGVKED